ncbi:T9SS type A sorting domain-containing protein [Haliscomenobacter sp.]|uniref:T9SS type A sorting domain-containing protein n=1 Tax=Haliscomenobacter sp. TaxID=2717303 RepID=UPI003BA8E053
MRQLFTTTLLFLALMLNLNAQSYRLVKDFAPGTTGGWREGSTMMDSMGNKALFSLVDAQKLNNIWVSDGTDAGTLPLVTLANGERVKDIFTWKGKKAIVTINESGSGRFWLSDGTKAGTLAITSAYSYLVGPVLLDSVMYFAAEESGSFYASFFRLNLGSRKVTKVFELGFYGLKDIVVAGNKLMMIANPSGVSSLWLMSSDGSAANTKRVYEIGTDFSLSNPFQLTAMGNKVFFYLSTSFFDPAYWYVSDGTAAGTKQVAKVDDNNNDFKKLKSLVVWNNKFYFPAVDLGGFSNTERYYVSDGTSAGTFKLEGEKAYQEPSSPRILKDKLYFHAFSPSYISDLFVTDGTPKGTTRPLDLSKLGGGLSFSGGQYAVFGDSIYLNAYRDETGWELWRTNGTTAGTVPVEWKKGPTEADPGNFLVVKDKLFLTINDPQTGRELWVYTPKSKLTPTQEIRSARDLLSFSPNPAQDQLQIHSLNADLGDGTLRIHNLFGQLILQQPLRALESRSIQLGNLPAGVYTLSLQQGDWMQVEKLVVE